MAKKRIVPLDQVTDDVEGHDCFYSTDREQNVWFHYYDPKTDTVYTKPSTHASGYSSADLQAQIDEGL